MPPLPQPPRSPQPPRRRVTARVLPVSPDGAVLLLQELDPSRPERPYWSSIGGGVDPGESHVDAAVRELREETGLVATADELGEPVHQGDRDFWWNGADRLAHHTYFALPLSRDAEVDFAGLQPDEVDTVLRAQWWTPADLAEEPAFEPPDLPDIMRAAVTAVEGAR